jgi:uncharacterized protein YjcR
VLEYASKEKLDELEIRAIEKYNSTTDSYGYNVRLGGNNSINTNSIVYHNLKNIINDIKNTKMYFKDIAKKYGVSGSTISRISSGIIWYQDNQVYPFRPIRKKAEVTYCSKCGSKLSKGKHISNLCINCLNKQRSNYLTKEQLVKGIKQGLYLQQIANKHGVSHTTVRRWLKRYGLTPLINGKEIYTS